MNDFYFAARAAADVFPVLGCAVIQILLHIRHTLCCEEPWVWGFSCSNLHPDELELSNFSLVRPEYE